MPWYELRVRGRLATASRLVPGFEVVEQVVTTVLTGRVEDTAEIQPVLAEVQALGLDVVEFHQVPERRAGTSAVHAAVGPGPSRSTSPRVELVALQVPSPQIPPPVTRVLNGLASDELVEVVDITSVERLEDGTLMRRPVRGLPRRLDWRLRRGDRWTVPLEEIAGRLAVLEPGEVVLLIALRARSPVELLEAAASAAGAVALLRVDLPLRAHGG